MAFVSPRLCSSVHRGCPGGRAPSPRRVDRRLAARGPQERELLLQKLVRLSMASSPQRAAHRFAAIGVPVLPNEGGAHHPQSAEADAGHELPASLWCELEGLCRRAAQWKVYRCEAEAAGKPCSALQERGVGGCHATIAVRYPHVCLKWGANGPWRDRRRRSPPLVPSSLFTSLPTPGLLTLGRGLLPSVSSPRAVALASAAAHRRTLCRSVGSFSHLPSRWSAVRGARLPSRRCGQRSRGLPFSERRLE